MSSFTATQPTTMQPGEERTLDIADFTDFEMRVPAGACLSCVFAFTSGSISGNARRAHFILEQDARLDLFGTVHLRGDSALTLKTEVTHEGPRSYSRTTVRAVAEDTAQLEYKGLIKITPTGHLSDAFLEQRALLLDEGTKAVMSPLLEIEADDIRASHAASVGKVDEEEIFYLQARGLSKAQAIRTISQGFLLVR